MVYIYTNRNLVRYFSQLFFQQLQRQIIKIPVVKEYKLYSNNYWYMILAPNNKFQGCILQYYYHS